MLLACSSSMSGVPDNAADLTPSPAAALPPVVLGVLQQGAYATVPVYPRADKPPTFSDGQRLSIAQALHVAAMRTQLRFLADGTSSGGTFIAEITNAGLDAAVSVLSGPDNAAGAVPPLTQAQIPAYKTHLSTALDSYTTALVMVENEEIAPKFYAGTPSTYALELAAAVAVGRAHGVPVTNGGLTNLPARQLTWNSYYVAGDFTRADSFARRAFSPQTTAQLPDATHPNRPLPSDFQAQLTLAQQYLAVYHGSAMDYLNVHLYFQLAPVGSSSGVTTPDELTSTMNEILTYVAAASGKPVVSGEMGQYDVNPATVDAMLRAAQLSHLAYAIWFSGDGDPAYALVSSASNAAGYTLRPAGSEFAAMAARLE
ncbi:MAG TPA: hypothetical protein VGC42_04475 [Kofleriaceae bacterium]